jgi:hypothetical protein
MVDFMEIQLTDEPFSQILGSLTLLGNVFPKLWCVRASAKKGHFAS